MQKKKVMSLDLKQLSSQLSWKLTEIHKRYLTKILLELTLGICTMKNLGLKQ